MNGAVAFFFLENLWILTGEGNGRRFKTQNLKANVLRVLYDNVKSYKFTKEAVADGACLPRCARVCECTKVRNH